jgi:hypothetical protein
MSDVTVGAVRKSIAIVPAKQLRRKVFHVCDRDGAVGPRA